MIDDARSNSNASYITTEIWNRQVMFPRYCFDSLSRSIFTKKFKKCWTKYYALPGSLVKHVKVRLVANTNRTLESFFIHKKASKRAIDQNGNIINNNYHITVSMVKTKQSLLCTNVIIQLLETDIALQAFHFIFYKLH